MKIKLQIKHRFKGSVLFEFEKEDNTIKETVWEAIKAGADLTGAELTGADLTGADLTGADLTGADLTGADLYRADLYRADLYRADLTGANLTGADLTEANLTGADLYRADLTGANLYRAELTGAELTGADLTGAELTGADLYRANLTEANLTGANLNYIKNDFWDVLLHSIPEIAFLKKNIIEGKIDGSTYEGECSCLSGTLVRGAKEHNSPQEKFVTDSIMKARNSNRPIERFFLNIKKGETPETNQVSKIVLSWLEEFEGFLINATIPV